MTETTPPTVNAVNGLSAAVAPARVETAILARLKKRRSAERRFRAYGIAAIAVALGFLATLLVTVFMQGASAFVQTHIRVAIALDPAVLGVDGASAEELARADYMGAIRAGLKARFPETEGRQALRDLSRLISNGAEYALRDLVRSDPSLIGTTQELWLLATAEIDMAVKGHTAGRLSDRQIGWLGALEAEDAVSLKFNTGFFTNGDSREPEMAGIRGAVMGSFYALLVTLALSFPLGVATAVYLEEFAPKNRWTALIEVNINNLAAVPSIVFGLLGLAVFLAIFGLPRSAPLVGGLVLTLMSLPTIIIASRAALKAVPPSIREAALGLGASRLQVVTDHVLPLAMPGILTGTILAMAQALGETAPLLMIGMVAFIVDIPGGPLDPSTVLPVQVFLWADSPERAFAERTSAAILVLLGFLAMMNVTAIWLRKKFERRW